ncbi:hypothetical protein SAMN05421788_106198 [Filimonas lacunae]|uniref:Uncharacterized protein n=1 Tax=Filimonas lacunae TaxID=477680 RepID=A0A173MFD0_9BACT|nr:hypothetical protein [Filimonas lacunae]BAV06138.1 hypothetical protein FLA_2153 [Filimonas lacunae]SIT24834.1 hypothetical protein SAMN05421788_106198 [Filimonas lacunae]
MFHTLSNLIGLPVNDSSIVDFIEKHGFKYPKKPFISNRSSDTSYWVQHKKLGIDLLFKAETFLSSYPLIKGDKKGIFVPVLASVRWYNNTSKSDFPLQVDFDDNYNTLQQKLGDPTLKSSDISPTWLNDDGTESFYRWEKWLNEEKSQVWGLEYTDDHTIKYVSLGLKYHNPLFQLYYEWLHETFEHLLQRNDFYNTAHLLFLQWAIENNLVKTNAATAGIMQDVKAGTQPITAWVESINRGYILADDFAAEERFVSAYINNLSSYDILYPRDIAYTFLPTSELKNNYMGQEATQLLNQIPCNEVTYALVKPVLDKRLAEYQEHRFKNSKQL